MTISTTVIPDVPENTLDPAAGLNLALNSLRTLVQAVVLQVGVSAPPVSPDDGDCVIVGTGTGAFSGHDEELAKYVAEGTFWEFYPPSFAANIVLNLEDMGLYVFDPTTGGGWQPVSGVGAAVLFMLSVSDLTTDITTGVSKAYLRSPYAFTITEVRASLIDASSSGAVTVDINEGGTTILSTKLSIDATEKTSTTAATAAVISDPNIADDSEITIDIDAAGTDARGLIVTIIGTKV